jgi:hypothetical protein
MVIFPVDNQIYFFPIPSSIDSGGSSKLSIVLWGIGSELFFWPLFEVIFVISMLLSPLKNVRQWTLQSKLNFTSFFYAIDMCSSHRNKLYLCPVIYCLNEFVLFHTPSLLIATRKVGNHMKEFNCLNELTCVAAIFLRLLKLAGYFLFLPDNERVHRLDKFWDFTMKEL